MSPRLPFILAFALCALVGTATATVAPDPFQQGRDYERLPAKVIAKTQTKGREVVEFFSYECPACNRFESTFGPWIKKAPQGVTVKRVPVVFRPSWEPLAKVYYIAKAFNVEDKITPAMFKAIHTDRKPMTDVKDLEALFAKFGVKPQDFRRAFFNSPAIDAQVKQGDALMRHFQVFQVPTIVVNGQFTTSPGFTRGDAKRLMAIVDYLVLTTKPLELSAPAQFAQKAA